METWCAADQPKSRRGSHGSSWQAANRGPGESGRGGVEFFITLQSTRHRRRGNESSPVNEKRIQAEVKAGSVLWTWCAAASQKKKGACVHLMVARSRLQRGENKEAPKCFLQNASDFGVAACSWRQLRVWILTPDL